MNIFKEAVRWYRLATDQGYASAQYNLGLRYANGEGVPQNYKEAVKLYRLAADQGYASAQNNLGTMYENGQGVLQNMFCAYALYNVASANDPSNSIAHENRDKTGNKMTPSQLEAGQRLSRELMRPGNFLKALDAATQ